MANRSMVREIFAVPLPLDHHLSSITFVLFERFFSSFPQMPKNRKITWYNSWAIDQLNADSYLDFGLEATLSRRTDHLSIFIYSIILLLLLQEQNLLKVKCTFPDRQLSFGCLSNRFLTKIECAKDPQMSEGPIQKY